MFFFSIAHTVYNSQVSQHFIYDDAEKYLPKPAMTGEIMTSRGLLFSTWCDRNQHLPSFKMPVHCIICSISLEPHSKSTKELPPSPFSKPRKKGKTKNNYAFWHIKREEELRIEHIALQILFNPSVKLRNLFLRLTFLGLWKTENR